jgi:hypothetical protein
VAKFGFPAKSVADPHVLGPASPLLLPLLPPLLLPLPPLLPPLLLPLLPLLPPLLPLLLPPLLLPPSPPLSSLGFPPLLLLHAAAAAKRVNVRRGPILEVIKSPPGAS